MSTLLIGNVRHYNSTVNNISFDASGNVLLSNRLPANSAPSGSVIQVVQTVITSSSTLSGPNGTPALVTGFSASITPTSATSKVLVTMHLMYSSTACTYGGWFKRNGTDIGLGDASGSKQRISMGMALVSDTNQTNTFTYNFLDTPATTSSCTYQFYVNNDNTYALYLNRSVNDSDSVTGKRGISTITLMEIAQ